MTDAVYLDFRVLYWGFLNQFAYCEGNPGHFPAFLKMIQSFGPLASSLGVVQPYLFGPESVIGNNLVTQAIQSQSDGFFPPIDPIEISAALKGSPVRVPTAEMNANIAVKNAMQPLRIPQDDYWNLRPQNFSTNVLYLNGLLDPNTPISLVEEDYFNSLPASGYERNLIILKNAGHTVIGK
jgi:hypothetical protein